MRRVIYLLAFFSVAILAWGIVTNPSGAEVTQAATPEESVSEKPREEKAKVRPPLYRPSLRPDGHLKIKPTGSYHFSSPFAEERQISPREGESTAMAGLRLTGLARSSRGLRAVLEQGQSAIALSEGETKAGITLREIDEESRTVLVHGPFGERVLRLNSSPP